MGGPSARAAERAARNGATCWPPPGYVVIHPARVPIADPAPSAPTAKPTASSAPDDCAHFIAHVRLRTPTTHYLVTHLADVAALDPALTGLLDARHASSSPATSAGSTVPLVNAGARQHGRPEGRVSARSAQLTVADRLPGHRRAGPDVRRLRSVPVGGFDGVAPAASRGIDRPFHLHHRSSATRPVSHREPDRRRGSPPRAPATCTCRGTPSATPCTRRWTSTSAIPRCAADHLPVDRLGRLWPSSTPSSGSGPTARQWLDSDAVRRADRWRHRAAQPLMRVTGLKH